jgi:glutamyl-tRNA reductase
MDATLVIIGLNFRTSPVDVRERFWLPEFQRLEILQELVRAEGIDEVMILATCNRTEFILWASDPSEGANSVLRLLTRKFNLKLSEWSNFYRLVDDTALLHLSRVAAGLDSMVLGEPQIIGHVRSAWQLAQRAGTTGRFLDAVLEKTLSGAKRARVESGLGTTSISVLSAAVDLGYEIFGDLSDRNVLLLGAGDMAKTAARHFKNAGVKNITIASRHLSKSEQLAVEIGANAVDWSHLREHFVTADIIISSTSSPDLVITSDDLASALQTRQNLPIIAVDVAVPRDIDPSVRGLSGVHLYDLDDLERMVQQSTSDQRTTVDAAEKILREELQGFRIRLMSEQVVPTIVALRHRLEEICGQELTTLEDQFGPFTEDQQHALHSLASHITQRIAGSMARELKEQPEQGEQKQLTEAVQRLFHLQPSRRMPPVTSN